MAAADDMLEAGGHPLHPVREVAQPLQAPPDHLQQTTIEIIWDLSLNLLKILFISSSLIQHDQSGGASRWWVINRDIPSSLHILSNISTCWHSFSL